ncbi:hypothetical protein [Streptomyces sp. HD]|uniref:hypothetical protein n=1 Tax=Streptomyces sp. HD TaxID=3020892 RepID=UPI00232C54C2|nr:hypothetical protein [Streptomyces sp. HD]MDC0773057.1 hypothetical protein [Streptomyces sp. HD]
MSARAGETFDVGQAVSNVEALLTESVPAVGPTIDEEDPGTQEWTITRGEGFVIVPLWESGGLTGLYEPQWNEEAQAAEGHLADLARELERRWGPHRRVAMHVPLFRKQAGEPMPPLFQALCDNDAYGDLTVWGPVQSGAEGGTDRWVGVSVGHSDGDAPLVMVAVASDRPIVELDGAP